MAKGLMSRAGIVGLMRTLMVVVAGDRRTSGLIPMSGNTSADVRDSVVRSATKHVLVKIFNHLDTEIVQLIVGVIASISRSCHPIFVLSEIVGAGPGAHAPRA